MFKSRRLTRFSAAAAALLLLTALAFSGCGSTMNKSLSEVNKEIASSSGFSDVTMTELTADTLKDYYDIDQSILKDFSVYIEGSGGFSDETAIFEVNASKDLEAVKASVETRLTRRKKDFDGYNPEELVKLEAATVATKGNYLIFLSAENPAEALEIFNKAFK